MHFFPKAEALRKIPKMGDQMSVPFPWDESNTFANTKTVKFSQIQIPTHQKNEKKKRNETPTKRIKSKQMEAVFNFQRYFLGAGITW